MCYDSLIQASCETTVSSNQVDTCNLLLIEQHQTASTSQLLSEHQHKSFESKSVNVTLPPCCHHQCTSAAFLCTMLHQIHSAASLPLGTQHDRQLRHVTCAGSHEQVVSAQRARHACQRAPHLLQRLVHGCTALTAG